MLSPLKYLSSFFFPIYVAWFLYSGPHDAISALIGTFPLWFIILVDWLSPKINPNHKKKVISQGYYDAILYVLTLFQFVIISLLIIYASHLQWDTIPQIAVSIINLIVLRILVGTTSGSSAIIVAHELIHRPKLHMRLLGRFLLYTVCYDHFIIAHIQGHHFNVATPEDTTTAKLGESFKSYWQRIVVAHFKTAWNYEVNRLGLSHSPIYHYKMLTNSVLQGLIVEITLVTLILIYFGWAAAIIFLYQALSGVRLLETINYYQHWGLEHGQEKNTLAWVNQSSFTEYALVGLSNHIDHHINPSLPFQELSYSEQGPKMPYGYFVTNLWVKLNNESYRQMSTEILTKPSTT